MQALRSLLAGGRDQDLGAPGEASLVLGRGTHRLRLLEKPHGYLAIECEEEVRIAAEFWCLIRDMPNVEGEEGLLGAFEEAWRNSQVFGQFDWYEPMALGADSGATPLCYVLWLKHSALGAAGAEGRRGPAFFDGLALAMMRSHPEAMSVVREDTKHEGETILHTIVANGDVELLDEVLQILEGHDVRRRLLNARAIGELYRNFLRFPEEYVHCGPEEGVTPLDVALIAPTDDTVALTLASKLLDAGASPQRFTKDGKPDGNILHRLAQCRWRWQQKVDSFIDPERLQAALDLFLTGRCALVDGTCELRRKTLFTDRDHHAATAATTLHPNAFVDTGEVNAAGFSAMQVAAICGNSAFLVRVLKCEVQRLYVWGHKCTAVMPVAAIDTANGDSASIIELLVIHRHRHVETIRVIHDAIEAKWQRFGRWCVLLEAIILLTIVLLVTIASLGEKTVRHKVKQRCQILVMVITGISALYVLLGLVRARRSEWFRSLAWLPSSVRASIFDVGMIRNLIAMLAICLALIAQKLQQVLDLPHTMNEYIDSGVAVVVFLLWLGLFRFMNLFENTGPVVQALPVILQRDAGPWMMVYLVMLCGFAVAIRVAVRHVEVPAGTKDEILGSFAATALTLEEATHGPDVQWREAVTNRPLMSGVYFLSFLWVVTVVLINLLIAMFSDTFESIRAESKKAVLHSKAVEVISHEKLLPPFLHKLCGCELGTSLPSLQALSAHKKHSASAEDDEEAPLLGAKGEKWMYVMQTASCDNWAEVLDSSPAWKG